MNACNVIHFCLSACFVMIYLYSGHRWMKLFICKSFIKTNSLIPESIKGITSFLTVWSVSRCSQTSTWTQFTWRSWDADSDSVSLGWTLKFIMKCGPWTTLSLDQDNQPFSSWVCQQVVVGDLGYITNQVENMVFLFFNIRLFTDPHIRTLLKKSWEFQDIKGWITGHYLHFKSG